MPKGRPKKMIVDAKEKVIEIEKQIAEAKGRMGNSGTNEAIVSETRVPLNIETPIILNTPKPPVRAVLHEAGKACGKHFIAMLNEGSHLAHLEALFEHGFTDETAVLALLKTCLDNAIWSSAYQYQEDATIVAQSGGAMSDRACKHCGGTFSPLRSGQLYCCNSCGHRAAGLAPVVEHEDVCPVLKKAA